MKLYYSLCISANRHRYSAFGRGANRTYKALLVPDPSDVPQWVNGAMESAVDEWRSDLAVLIDRH